LPSAEGPAVRWDVQASGFLLAKPGQDDGLSAAARAAPYLSAMTGMVTALLVGTVAGLLSDWKLGTGPWGVVVGLGVGFGAGLWSLIRNLSQLEKRR
jgi:F0F1-type ATP synthase assembly protein I